MVVIEKLYSYKNWQLFTAISGITLLLMFAMQYRLLDIDVLANLMGNQMSLEQIENMFEMQQEYRWLGYVLSPFILLLKTAFAAFFIHMVLVFADKDVTYKDIFKLNLIAGSALLLLSLVQTVMVYSVDIDTITQKFLEMGNLSLGLLANPETTLIPLQAFLGVLNPYEGIYVVLTMSGLKYITKENTKKSVHLTFLVWSLFTVFIVVIQSFIQLNLK